MTGRVHPVATGRAGRASASPVLGVGWRSDHLEFVLTDAEPVFSHQREIIGRGLAPVHETYGLAEMVTAASECGEGFLHTWPDAGWLEVIEDDVAVAPGSPGELVCTGLLNESPEHIARELRKRLGDIRTLMEPVEKIPRGSNGKFRAVICDLAPESMESLPEMVGR